MKPVTVDQSSLCAKLYLGQTYYTLRNNALLYKLKILVYSTQGRREKLVSGGGLAGIFGDLFFRTQTNLKFPSEKILTTFFFFSNFSHFFHTPPTTAPRTPPFPCLHPWRGPHPTFRGGGFSPPQPPLSTPLYYVEVMNRGTRPTRAAHHVSRLHIY
jgi:hypothetical protein